MQNGKFPRRMTWLASLALVLGGAGTAGADLLVYDGFDYAEGPLANLDGGTGWGGAWKGNSALSTDAGATVQPGSLTPPAGYLTTPIGGSIKQTAMLAYRALAPATQIDLGADQDYYVSYLAERTNIDRARAYSLSLFEGTTSAIAINTSTGGTASVTVPGFPTKSADVNTVGTGSTTLWAVKIAARSGDTPDQVFIRTYSTALSTVPVTEPAADEWTLVSDAFVASHVIDRIGFAMGSGAALQVDEFRMGTEWGDVAAVPEPAAASLLLAGAALVVGRRGGRRA